MDLPRGGVEWGLHFGMGNRVKKKRNTIKNYSASLPIQSLLQTLVCPSCVNAYQSANQGQMFFIRIVYPPPLEKKILGR